MQAIIYRFIQTLFLVISVLVIASAARAISPEVLARGLPSLAPMIAEVTPAVVNIRVTRPAGNGSRLWFHGRELPDGIQEYLENMPELQRLRPRTSGAGSGVIVDAAAGYVVTNHHVVANASEITVQTADNRTFSAELVGSDERTDIALLRIDADKLTELPFADIDTVQIGDYAVAIGNPFGIGQTVTAGIVSALGRAGINNENYEDYIQTDAAINVGNSGGALVDVEGRLIGINTAIISGNGGSNGVGFAVPVDMVVTVMRHLERDGEVRRGMLGVSITDVTSEVVTALGVDVERGALVTAVMPGSAAEAAGIEVSDIIVAMDGAEIGSSRELRNLVGLALQGEEVELTLYRDGQRLAVAAVIGSASGAAQPSLGARGSQMEFRGARLRSLAAADGLAVTDGVLVLGVEPRSDAHSAGLREGDIIVTVNRRPVADLAAFEDAVAQVSSTAALTVNRDGREMLLFVPRIG